MAQQDNKSCLSTLYRIETEQIPRYEKAYLFILIHTFFIKG